MAKTPSFERAWLPSGHQVGARVGSWGQDQQRAPTVLVDLQMCVEPLSPRDAFFGGRTNALKLHYESKEDEGEQIKYVDMTSLYPWVNKTHEYPVGHPTVITNPENQDIRAYFGIAKNWHPSASSPVSSCVALSTWKQAGLSQL